ncbi:type I polyketide synthase [Nocardia sp. NPDC004278]
MLGSDRTELMAGLHAVAEGEPSMTAVQGDRLLTGKTVFVFPGQGSQWVGMAAELMDSSPVFAAAIDQCAGAFAPHVSWSLTDVLRDTPGAASLDRVDVVQPALFAVMVSLAQLWQSIGVMPDAVVGHSQGEIAAAYVAGALSLSDAATVVISRSRMLAKELAGAGGMVSVALPAEALPKLLAPWRDRIGIAAVNGPNSTVVSGDSDALTEFMTGCAHDGIRTRRIPVDYAAHSAQVEVLRLQLLKDLRGIEPRSSRVAFYSSVTGSPVDTAVLDAEYWYRNLRGVVSFAQTIAGLHRDGHRFFVEASPHPVLTTGVHETLESIDTKEGDVVVAASTRRGDGGMTRFMSSAAELFVAGASVNWAPMLSGGQRVDLPTFAFQRRRFWLETLPNENISRTVDADLMGEFWDSISPMSVEARGIDPQQRFVEVYQQLSTERRAEQLDRNIKSWSYRITWSPIERAPAPLSGRWLIVTPSDHPDLRSIEHQLNSIGAVVCTLEVNPTESNRESIGEQIDAYRVDGELTGVLSLLAFDEEFCPEHRSVTQGLAGTVCLLQALLDTRCTVPTWIVTSGAVGVEDSDTIVEALQFQVWGATQVASLENPDFRFGLIDLPKNWDSDDLALLVPSLSGDTDEDQIAVRKTGTFARRMSRTAHSTVSADNTWIPRGTVLITGGTGGIGSPLAKWLVKRGAQQIVVASRRGPDAAAAATLRDELQDLGASIVFHTCDVAKRDEVANLLAVIDQSGAELTAVIHAAGVSAETPIGAINNAELEAVLAPKVVGARHLDELLGERPLDAFVLFSSGAAVWGSRGLGSYAAANAFLDGLAQSRRARGRAATSIAWGLWSGKGMGEAEDIRRQLHRTGIRSMDPEFALAALQRSVESHDPTAIVADIDWERFGPAYTLARRRGLISDLMEVPALSSTENDAATTPESSDLVQELARMSADSAEELLLTSIRGTVSTVLGHPIEEIDERRPFTEMGMDSLAAIEVRSRLNKRLGLALPTTVAFDYPCARELLEHIQRSLGISTPAHGGDVVTEIEKLWPLISSLDTDNGMRVHIVSRLSDLLSRTKDRFDMSATADLDTVSDDELFNMIDNELGL